MSNIFDALIFDMALSSTGTQTINGRRVGSTQGTVSAYVHTATNLPGDTNVLALQSTATVAPTAV